ncbi:MAG: Mu transposase domain-containing protein [Acidiferrobacterales bacterium]
MGYHIVVDDRFYGALYALVRDDAVVWCHATHHTLELFYRGKRVASHPRSFRKYDYSTTSAHRPAAHQAHLDWTPSRLIGWGKTIGPSTGALIADALARMPHPEQGYRSTLGIPRLSRKFGNDRLRRACEKATANLWERLNARWSQIRLILP